MMKSLDLSGKIEKTTVDIFTAINTATSSLGISYIAIGAMVRDLVFCRGYGVAESRRTMDIDFAIQVDSWEFFNQLTEFLIKNGFQKTRENHRLIESKSSIPIDIVPFGKIAIQNKITWPPNGDVVMDVRGFQEAYEHAVKIKISSKPEVVIPVVTIPSLMILKIIAWSDRVVDKRSKDAIDILYLFNNYNEIEDVGERIYTEKIIDKYNWDLQLASSHLLGMDAAMISKQETQSSVSKILEQNLIGEEASVLLNEMSNFDPDTYDKNYVLLEAFATGYIKTG